MTQTIDTQNDHHFQSNKINVNQDFAGAVLKGLSSKKKSIPSRYLYDAKGSVLFEEITELEEYYPTRTEIKLLEENTRDMVGQFPEGAVLVEFGSGSSRKTEILLRTLPHLKAYIPVDVSPTALDDAKARLTKKFPDLRIAPIVANFMEPFALPDWCADAPKIGFFPGSTIGNFKPSEAIGLLEYFAQDLGCSSRLILGVDLKKDEDRLVAAYDDREGVTAEFNLNVLTRVNRELDGTFDVSGFRHVARYNENEGRMEMHLESRKDQSVEILGRRFDFKKGESLHTENSYKYSVQEFHDIGDRAGWENLATWTDEESLFSVHLMTPACN